MLFTEERDADQKLKLMLFMTPPLIVGVTLRLVSPYYRFADLSLEGAFLMGLLGGRVVGPIGGAIITIPALMAHEWLGMPAASTAGLLGGLIRQVIPDKEALWNFGPFTFLNIPKALMRMIRDTEIMWEMLPLLTCVGLELGRVALVEATKPKWLFALDPHWNWQLTGRDRYAHVCRLAFENLEQHPHRDESRTPPATPAAGQNGCALQPDQSPLLVQHTQHRFALIRIDPDTARGVVLKLSNILRLCKHETFVPLRRNSPSSTTILDIEVARFGHDNLDIVKEIDEVTREHSSQYAAAAHGRKQPGTASHRSSKAAASSCGPPARTAACRSKLPTTASASRKKCLTSTSKASA